jgi:quercetin dioxygenase-like cupin family protein
MQDKTGQAVGTPKCEDDNVRVTEWRFAPGAATGWHRHEYDYVVVPLLDGRLRIDLGNGEFTISDLKRGVPYHRPVGVEHDVINANDYEFAFLEVELKR